MIRKRQQIDNLSELPKDKQPTNEILWDGTSEDLEEWIDKVLDHKHTTTVADINLADVEG